MRHKFCVLVELKQDFLLLQFVLVVNKTELHDATRSYLVEEELINQIALISVAVQYWILDVCPLVRQ